MDDDLRDETDIDYELLDDEKELKETLRKGDLDEL